MPALTEPEIDDLVVKLDDQRERIAELEAALRPFAIFGEALSTLGGCTPRSGDMFVIHGDEPVAITVEDLETAARVGRRQWALIK